MKITTKVIVALKKMLSLSLSKIDTENGVLVFEDGIELAEGVEVFVEDAEAEDGLKPAPDGDYKADGKTIKVAEGKVTEIVEDVPAISEEEAKFNSHKVEMSASYNEITRNIQEAINKTGVNGWIVEAAADYAIVSVWNGEKEVFFRYELTTNEDGTVVLGESSEVKPAFISAEEPAEEPKEEPEDNPVQMADEPLEPNDEPADEPKDEPADEPEVETVEDRLARIENLFDTIKNSLDSIINNQALLEERIATIEEKVAKVDAKPAAEPAEELSAEENDTPKSKMSYLRK